MRNLARLTTICYTLRFAYQLPSVNKPRALEKLSFMVLARK